VPYRAEKPALTPDADELRRRIPGWGVDLDPAVRPAVPKERYNPGGTGAHWDIPEEQVPREPRERSPEHLRLTPVFGTGCPPRGVAGALRWRAYGYSEGRAVHWLLLMLADRVDVVETRLRDALRGRPDNAVAEYGLRAEATRGGVRSRLGQGRADVKRLSVQALVLAAVGVAVATAVARRRRQSAFEDRFAA
jgi:hypothetical protein